MVNLGENKLLLKTTDYKFIRGKDDLVTLRVYEVVAGEEEYRFCAGPVVPTENKLPKKKFHGWGETQEEAIQDCINKIEGIDIDSMFTKPPPMLPPSSIGTFG